MYPLPEKEELNFFVGLKISEVKIFDYTVIIKFENSPIEINGYKECLFIKNKHIKEKRLFDKEENKLIGHKIIDFYINKNELYLKLDNDLEVVLSGKDMEYECFTISGYGGTFVV